MAKQTKTRIGIVAGIMGLAALSGCTKPAPPPPTPVAVVVPVVVAPPPRPVPPGGAPLGLTVPPIGADGVRSSINSGLSLSQKVWNLRSALNVAALTCRDPKYTGITQAYNKMLSQNKVTLAAVYKRVIGEYRDKHGRKHLPQFDADMTKLYNYFSLPAARQEFCDTANEIATESLTIEGRTAMEPFADSALARLDGVFLDFFDRYEQYFADVAAWDAKYGENPIEPDPSNPFAQQPGAVASPDASGSVPAQPAANSTGVELQPDTKIEFVDVKPSPE